MTTSSLVRVPVRMLLAAAFVAACWMLLAPSDAHAEEPSPAAGSGLLGGVTKALGRDVVTPLATTVSTTTRDVGRATGAVLETGADAASGTTRTVTRVTDDVAAQTPVAPGVKPPRQPRSRPSAPQPRAVRRRLRDQKSF